MPRSEIAGTSVHASVSFVWQRRGQVIPHFPASGVRVFDTLSFSWPNIPSAHAGLYRITIIGVDGFQWIYIGEAAYLPRRLHDYTKLYRSRPAGTQSRITTLIRKTLIEDGAVYLDTVSTGKLAITGAERRIVMRQKAERQFAEAAAVIQEEQKWLESEEAWVLNKILDDSGRSMFTPLWDVPGRERPKAD
jgi:hypothetical protein